MMINTGCIHVEAGDGDELRHYVSQVELLIRRVVVWIVERSMASESVHSLFYKAEL